VSLLTRVSRTFPTVADFFLGVLAVLAGLIFCFSGYFWLRIALPVWGAFVGFAFGAGLVAGLGGDRFLGEVVGWVVGLAFAALFALVAYAYFAFAVVIAMTSVGFAIGSGLVVALGIDWSWVAVVVGVLVGAIVCVASILVNLPAVVLTTLSAIGGAIAVVAGLMLVTGAMNSADFTGDAFADQVHDDWWWYFAVVVLALVGTINQMRDASAVRRRLRAGWASSTPG
jgi:hypothetical protein